MKKFQSEYNKTVQNNFFYTFCSSRVQSNVRNKASYSTYACTFFSFLTETTQSTPMKQDIGRRKDFSDVYFGLLRSAILHTLRVNRA